MNASDPSADVDTPQAADRPSFRYQCALRTDVGMRRAMNQDAIAVAPSDERSDSTPGERFLIVADGMGAHAAGELASKIAVDTVPHVFAKSKNSAAPDALRKSIREANERIYAKGSSSPEFEGMGTTCSCLLLADGMALVGHVGDSRVYRMRQGALEQLTFDHSLVWEMAAASNVTEDKVPAYIPKNVITRSLGPHEVVNIDLEGPYAVEQDDRYLLCSDGLTGVVNDQMIGALMQVLSPQEAVETLVDLANLAGGPDNISIAIAKAESPIGPASVPCCKKQYKPWISWVLAAFFFLLSCWQITIQNEMGALFASVAALLAFLTTLLPKKFLGYESTIDDSTCMSVVGIHGNGPYRNHACTDLGPSAKALKGLVDELAEVPFDDSSREEKTTDSDNKSGASAIIEPKEYRQQVTKANDLINQQDYPSAIRAYSKLIGLRMHLAKEYRSSQESSDRAI